MAFPIPQPALVICYSYLWHREFAAGREEGIKDRPCAIVAAVKTEDDSPYRVLVLPVTHRAPAKPEAAIEIPLETKQRLGLDHEQSWVCLTEWNEFLWPGPDLRILPGGNENTIAYGFLPYRLFEKIQAAFAAKALKGSAHRVKRTE
jgi:hypothetical protein